MDTDVWEAFGHAQNVLAITLRAAPILPALGDLAAGIAEHRKEAMLDGNLVAEHVAYFIEPRLRHVGPDAEDIRVVAELDGAAHVRSMPQPAALRTAA
jgi:hypothetical protein